MSGDWASAAEAAARRRLLAQHRGRSAAWGLLEVGGKAWVGALRRLARDASASPSRSAAGGSHPRPSRMKLIWGFTILGYHIGVLTIRGSYYLGVYIEGPKFPATGGSLSLLLDG